MDQIQSAPTNRSVLSSSIFTSAPLLSTKWTFNIPMEGIEKPHDYSGQHSSQTQLRPSLSLRYSLQPTEQIPAWDTPHSIHSIAIERWIETDKLNSSWPEKYRFTGHRTKGRPANGQIIVNSLPESGWRHLRQPVENPKCDLLWSLDLDFMLMVINENHTPTQLSLTLSVTLQPTIGCCFTWKKAH